MLSYGVARDKIFLLFYFLCASLFWLRPWEISFRLLPDVIAQKKNIQFLALENAKCI